MNFKSTSLSNSLNIVREKEIWTVIIIIIIQIYYYIFSSFLV